MRTLWQYSKLSYYMYKPFNYWRRWHWQSTQNENWRIWDKVFISYCMTSVYYTHTTTVKLHCCYRHVTLMHCSPSFYTLLEIYLSGTACWLLLIIATYWVRSTTAVVSYTMVYSCRRSGSIIIMSKSTHSQIMLSPIHHIRQEGRFKRFF